MGMIAAEAAQDVAAGVVIRAGSTVDIHTVPGKRRQLRETVARHGAVTVDLNETEFMDASGLGMLVAAHQAARGRGGQLVVACSREPLLRTFRVAGLSAVLDIRPAAPEGWTALGTLADD